MGIHLNVHIISEMSSVAPGEIYQSVSHPCVYSSYSCPALKLARSTAIQICWPGFDQNDIFSLLEGFDSLIIRDLKWRKSSLLLHANKTKLSLAVWVQTENHTKPISHSRDFNYWTEHTLEAACSHKFLFSMDSNQFYFPRPTIHINHFRNRGPITSHPPLK